ncbi:hypothetical protein L839_5660, partial [Mycobacterium avium MAV_120809_2495]
MAAAVKDTYAGLKRLITDRYKGVDPTGVENKPSSEAKRASLEEDLKDAGAEQDADLLAAAKAVIEASARTIPRRENQLGRPGEDRSGSASYPECAI